MELYEVFTRDDTAEVVNIWNTDIISDDLCLDLDDSSDITFKNIEVINELVTRHGEKRLVDIPKWLEKRSCFAGTENNEYGRYAWFCQDMWERYLKNMLPQFKRMYTAITAEYNPIENYDRHELFTDTDSGSNTLEYEGSVSLEKNGTAQTSRSDNDVLSYDGSEKVSNTDVSLKANTGTQSVGFAGTETSTENGTETNATESTNTTSYAGKETNKETGTDSTENTYTDGTVYSGEEYETDIGDDVSTKNGTHTDTKTDTHSEKAFNDVEAFTAVTKDVSENVSQDSNVQESVRRENTKQKFFTDRQDETSHTGTDIRIANLTNEKSFENRIDTTNIDSDETKNVDITNTKSFSDRQDTTTFDLSENLDSTNETERTFTDRKDSRTVTCNDIETTDTEDLTSYRDRKDVTTFGKVATHEARLHGNIGITTSMTMQKEELEGRRFELLKEIVDMYAMRICY